jgi:hypothetical protein
MRCRRVGRDLQVARTSKKSIVKVDVILLDRLSKIIDSFILIPFFEVSSLQTKVLTGSLPACSALVK